MRVDYIISEFITKQSIIVEKIVDIREDYDGKIGEFAPYAPIVRYCYSKKRLNKADMLFDVEFKDSSGWFQIKGFFCFGSRKYLERWYDGWFYKGIENKELRTPDGKYVRKFIIPKGTKCYIAKENDSTSVIVIIAEQIINPRVKEKSNQYISDVEKSTERERIHSNSQ